MGEGEKEEGAAGQAGEGEKEESDKEERGEDVGETENIQEGKAGNAGNGNSQVVGKKGEEAAMEGKGEAAKAGKKGTVGSQGMSFTDNDKLRLATNEDIRKLRASTALILEEAKVDAPAQLVRRCQFHPRHLCCRRHRCRHQSGCIRQHRH